MGIKIALAGNPNCGKTTLFNDLTGSSQYVGNWPGVTVEKKDSAMSMIFTSMPFLSSMARAAISASSLFSMAFSFLFILLYFIQPFSRSNSVKYFSASSVSLSMRIFFSLRNFIVFLSASMQARFKSFFSVSLRFSTPG